MSVEPGAQNMESCRVGVRVPPFYPEKPALWFAQLEGQFQLATITADSTKFYYAISQLEPQYAAEVEDVITNPPMANKYDRLKTELIKRLSASREKKVKQLLIHEELGDRKPSQFVRHLQNLAGPGVPEEFLRTIWTSRLPASTQTIIASQPKATLEELAELADRIHDVVPPILHVASTSAATSSGMSINHLNQQIEDLTKQVSALTTRLDRISRNSERQPFNRLRKRSQFRSRSASNHKKYPNCWYHAKFGDQARKCIQRCDFLAGNATGNR
ncbi:uncharacterized protein LOC128200775 [Galleria mellonella]|uniref:Uncharacterized protein LOC128200775 n=1 Tax=Galleria mellonella TaxID=7137 RepID=A0ABM3MIM1_GALME|nr:uncharacterized protein LOC128200775 [Galleria mellonella]